MKTYREKDFTLEFLSTVNQAKILWREICKKNFERDGDYGSCVCGAGISVIFLPKRCRKPIRKQIISAREVAYAQGSLNWENGKDAVMELLKNAGIECVYDWGWLD